MLMITESFSTKQVTLSERGIPMRGCFKARLKRQGHRDIAIEVYKQHPRYPLLTHGIAGLAEPGAMRIGHEKRKVAVMERIRLGSSPGTGI
jgi:hypothetical protein